LQEVASVLRQSDESHHAAQRPPLARKVVRSGFRQPRPGPAIKGGLSGSNRCYEPCDSGWRDAGTGAS
jgi:hypothetical protein